MLAAAVAAAAIVVVLLATGAFSGGSKGGGPKPAAAAKTTTAAAPTTTPAAAPLLGTWQGTATQTATTRETFPAEVRMTVTLSTVGKKAGTLSEKARGLTCAGRLKLAAKEASYVFHYDENADAPTGCVDSTTVTVTPSAGGDIDFYEIYTADDGNQGTVVGKLKRTGGAP